MGYYKNKCIICGEATTRKDYDFCIDCYYAIQNINEEEGIEEEVLFGNFRKIKNLYKKTYNNAINSSNDNELIEQLQLLFAISDTLYEVDAYEDIDKIKQEYKNRKNKQKFVEDFKNNDYRNKWPKEFQCDDGHYVRSFYELILDNWLYHHNYKHEYEKSIFMPSDPNEIVLTDFYLPKEDVYIELWGRENDKQYTNREERKKYLYDKNKFKRIDLTKEHLKRLNDILPREIKSK